MIKYKRINKDDKIQVENLRKEVLEKLERPEFYMQGTEEERQKMFEKTILYGAYDEKNLVGMTKLYIDQEYLKEIKYVFKLQEYKVCDLGGALVKCEYRNQGIMQRLIDLQKQTARNLEFDYIVATIHPENISSNRAFEKSGFKVKGQAIFEEIYLRNLCVMKIEK